MDVSRRGCRQACRSDLADRGEKSRVSSDFFFAVFFYSRAVSMIVMLQAQRKITEWGWRN
jgi:hypothetical protein